MSTLLPSWYTVTSTAAVNDVKTRYLFNYTSDPPENSLNYLQHPDSDFVNQLLTDSLLMPPRANVLPLKGTCL